MIAELPASGRFIVDTLDAAYDVDIDARVVTRTDFAANEVTVDETFMVEQISAVKGGPLVVDYWLGLAGEDAGRHTSTTVLGITPVPVEVAA